MNYEKLHEKMERVSELKETAPRVFELRVALFTKELPVEEIEEFVGQKSSFQQGFPSEEKGLPSDAYAGYVNFHIEGYDKAKEVRQRLVDKYKEDVSVSINWSRWILVNPDGSIRQKAVELGLEKESTGY